MFGRFISHPAFEERLLWSMKSQAYGVHVICGPKGVGKITSSKYVLNQLNYRVVSFDDSFFRSVNRWKEGDVPIILLFNQLVGTKAFFESLAQNSANTGAFRVLLILSDYDLTKEVLKWNGGSKFYPLYFPPWTDKQCKEYALSLLSNDIIGRKDRDDFYNISCISKNAEFIQNLPYSCDFRNNRRKCYEQAWQKALLFLY